MGDAKMVDSDLWLGWIAVGCKIPEIQKSRHPGKSSRGKDVPQDQISPMIYPADGGHIIISKKRGQCDNVIM